MLRRVLLAVAVLVTVAAIFLWTRLPPKQQSLTATFSDGTVPGALHVHSSRSDGRGTPEEIAHDAARAGLKFVVITDHADATAVPAPPVYREGVLCLEGTEISTRDGHYIALDMPAAPYPLGGDGRAVVEDVKRLGGFGVVAHPDSPKPELQWRAWSAPFDAVEVLNLDTMWRRRVADPRWQGKAALQIRLLTYAFRPAESVASLVLRSAALEQWSEVADRRHLVMLGGTDAHAQIAWRASDPIAATLSIPLPSYTSIFRAMSVRVRLERALTGDAKTDAAMLFRALRAGHLYTAVDGIATPPAFELTATNALGTVRMGDQLDVGGPLTLRVRSNAPDGFTTTIWDGVKAVAIDRRERDFSLVLPGDPGVYWAEVHPGGRSAPVPWITSNPVYVRSTEPPLIAAPPPVATVSTPLFDGQSTTGWRVHHDDASVGEVDAVASPAGEGALRLRFGLASAPTTSQFVALGVDAPQGIASSDRVTFAARAEQPMRISVQVMTEQSRWERSVYVDTFSQAHTVMFHEFRPVAGSGENPIPLDRVTALLFVIDTTNTKPGTSGQLWIGAPALAK
ncbi:MAG TPA: hypothetical protein VLV86_09235 [Vicinamibacterales bacterium]|nr:hypothetical protein [Vicinamibacterales bacterium]